MTPLSPRVRRFSRNNFDGGFERKLDRRVASFTLPRDARRAGADHGAVTRPPLNTLSESSGSPSPSPGRLPRRRDGNRGDQRRRAPARHRQAAIPDRLLHKPGPLSAAEYELVKRHAAIGADILDGLQFGESLAQIVRHHHENWDGSGYPDRLRGYAIPIGARILAVVDCYDALTSERPYREPLTHADAVDLIVSRCGTMYDPAILEVFVRVRQRQRLCYAVCPRELSARRPSGASRRGP